MLPQMPLVKNLPPSFVIFNGNVHLGFAHMASPLSYIQYYLTVVAAFQAECANLIQSLPEQQRQQLFLSMATQQQHRQGLKRKQAQEGRVWKNPRTA